MKIIYHHRTRGEDAQGIHIRSLQDAWSELGHEVIEVSLSRQPTQAANAPKNNPTTKHSEGRSALGSLVYEAMSLGYNFYGMNKLKQAIRVNQPAFIYERYSLNLTAGATVAKKFKLPLVVEINAPLVDEMAKESSLMGTAISARCEKYVINAATKIIVVSEVLKQHYVKQGFDANKFQVIHNGIDPQLFHTGVNASAVREKYSLGNRCVLGFVGWARQWHRLDLLLEAYAALPNRQDFAVLIAGDGPAIPGLKEQANQLGISDAVHFTGALHHSAIPEHIAAMDITVVPSIPVYASPMKLFEYMAMGKAVLVPDQPNLHEIITEGVNGLFIPKDDPNGFVKTVTTLAVNAELRAKVSRGASDTIQNDKYFWTENARRVLQVVGLS